MHYFDDYLLLTASLLCDWFYILWLRPCKDVLERVNKYNTILHYNAVVGQVIGVPDSRLGEEVCACIRLMDGAKLTADQVKQYCKGKV
jgi:acyl-CoA synthetase (AMP-forming)/AMP-acid ligase II